MVSHGDMYAMNPIQQKVWQTLVKEKLKNGRERLIIKSIPYQVNKSTLLENMASLVREKKLKDIPIDNSFPKYIRENKDILSEWIL